MPADISWRADCKTPLIWATEKSVQGYALLFPARDCRESGTFGNLNAEIQSYVLTLTARLALETLVLRELAAQSRGRYGRSRAPSSRKTRHHKSSYYFWCFYRAEPVTPETTNADG